MSIGPDRDRGESGGSGRGLRRWPRDILAAVLLTLAALALLGLTFVGHRSPVSQPVASTAAVDRN